VYSSQGRPRLCVEHAAEAIAAQCLPGLCASRQELERDRVQLSGLLAARTGHVGEALHSAIVEQLFGFIYAGVDGQGVLRCAELGLRNGVMPYKQLMADCPRDALRPNIARYSSAPHAGCFPDVGCEHPEAAATHMAFSMAIVACEHAECPIYRARPRTEFGKRVVWLISATAATRPTHGAPPVTRVIETGRSHPARSHCSGVPAIRETP
jgi:hypothetical protein